mgnify:CR=1 FL=1
MLKVYWPKGHREAQNLERVKSAMRSLGVFLILFGLLGLVLLHV